MERIMLVLQIHTYTSAFLRTVAAGLSLWMAWHQLWFWPMLALYAAISYCNSVSSRCVSQASRLLWSKTDGQANP